MDTIQHKIQDLKNNPHCVNCGMLHPEMIEGGDDFHQAYTKCCNEAVCDRLNEYKFGNNEVCVKACCWAMAELQFQAKGIDVIKQQGMSRLKD